MQENTELNLLNLFLFKTEKRQYLHHWYSDKKDYGDYGYRCKSASDF